MSIQTEIPLIIGENLKPSASMVVNSIDVAHDNSEFLVLNSEVPLGSTTIFAPSASMIVNSIDVAHDNSEFLVLNIESDTSSENVSTSANFVVYNDEPTPSNATTQATTQNKQVWIG